MKPRLPLHFFYLGLLLTLVLGSTFAASPTFTKDIAPILFKNCSNCHHDGGSAPFNLLTYRDAQKHAQQIAEVTASRLMPPWMPEPGGPKFADERRLSPAEIAIFQKWFENGAPEGDPADLPPLPSFEHGWQLGKPDLILHLPQGYTLPADGKDVYRNFVVPVSSTQTQYVRAVEFRPANPRLIHHAFIRVDSTRQSRRHTARDRLPGFDGMQPPASAQMPDGHFLSWQPGKMYSAKGQDLTWPLLPRSDLVLQLHMRPTGKPEPLDVAVGLYFTNQPSAVKPYKILLTSLTMDIPPGATNYEVSDEYVLPVDVDLVGILPHTHYLGNRIEGSALFPDGTQTQLLLIKKWDFNWQGDYRYAEPVFLPKGTKLSLHLSFDNSTNNPANPNNPPKRVGYGPESSDEMAELSCQVILRNPADINVLRHSFGAKMARARVECGETLLKNDPRNLFGHLFLAQGRMGAGDTQGAYKHFSAIVEQNPSHAEAWFNLGQIFLSTGHFDNAGLSFQKVLAVDPEDAEAIGSLGLAYLGKGDVRRASNCFRRALQLNPEDAVARKKLSEIVAASHNDNNVEKE